MSAEKEPPWAGAGVERAERPKVACTTEARWSSRIRCPIPEMEHGQSQESKLMGTRAGCRFHSGCRAWPRREWVRDAAWSPGGELEALVVSAVSW